MRRSLRVPRRVLFAFASGAGLVAGALGLGDRLAAQRQPEPPRADATPLRLVGTFDGKLERVAMRPDGSALLTVRLPATGQAFARGDDVHLFDATDRPVGTGSVAADARGAPGTDHVHVAVRFADATTVARLAAIPHERFVRATSPKVTIRTTYRPERGDRLADFVRIVRADGTRADVIRADVIRADGTRADGAVPVVAAACVPPDCAFVLRFDRRLDPATLDGVELRIQGVAGAAAIVPVRVVALDDTGTVFRFAPPLGLAVTPAMQQAARERPGEPHYVLGVAAGGDGPRGTGGEAFAAPLALPIAIDFASPINLVGWRTFRVR